MSSYIYAKHSQKQQNNKQKVGVTLEREEVMKNVIWN